uniref:Large ribosomal subunit protein bL35m n=1 Tax=Ditylenchus dipsaci TaxID=166011 RepID=A0A915DQM8_9BILA
MPVVIQIWRITFDLIQGLQERGPLTMCSIGSRVNSGLWIRTVPARNKKRYMKNEMFNQTCDDYLICSQEQCNMLDRMMTPFWLRKKYYVDDPYEPFNVRHGMDSPRVNDKKELVRERRKVLMDDTTADKFFNDR